MSTPQRFSLVFAVALILQTFIWHHTVATDQDLWTKRIENFVPHKLVPEDITLRRYSTTPGALTMLVARRLLPLDISIEKSLYLSISILVSLAAATAASLAHTISPKTWWWIMVGAITAVHPLYVRSTPVDAVGAPLLAACVLAFLWYERNHHKASLASDIGLSFLIAAGAATRLHMTALIVIPALLLLRHIIGWRHLLVVTGSALAFTIALNPFLGYIPMTYIQAGVLGHTISYAQEKTAQFSGSEFHLSTFAFASLAALSLVISSFYLFFWKHLRNRAPISRRFIVSLMLITALVVGVLLTSSLHIQRYFFPIVLIWETLLPLFLIHLLTHSPRVQLQPAFVNMSVILLTTVPAISLMVYTLLIPTTLP